MKTNEVMTLEQYGDKLINEDLNQLVKDNPYFAFIVMSSAIEFIARCRSKLNNFHSKNNTSKRYMDAINSLSAFEKYRVFNVTQGKGQTNKLYTAIRCGLLHATMPNKGIILSSKNNDLTNNVIGCISLYEDVKAAWKEIKSDRNISNYLKNNKGIVITRELPKNNTMHRNRI